MGKEISDEFKIKIGNTAWGRAETKGKVGNFICKSVRLGVEEEYRDSPFFNHNIEDWIISEFGLISFKNYKIKVNIELLGEEETDT